jgi:phosphohistidine phosphatase
MRRLILMRHGDAERPAPGLSDVERALTAEGRAEARAVAGALAKAGFAPDVALVSAARRTLQTWEAAAPAFPGATMQAELGLYAASAGRLLQAVREAPEAETLMLVGHNPGIHQLAFHLAQRAGAQQEGAKGKAMERLERGLSTGSAAVFEIGKAGPTALAGLFRAKDFRSDGE